MDTNRIFARSSLGGMGWRETASSRPGRFQTRRNASPESLSRGAIFQHRPGGTRSTILKLPRPRRRPWTTWLTRKLLWTPGTRRRGKGNGAAQQSEVEATKATARLPVWTSRGGPKERRNERYKKEG